MRQKIAFIVFGLLISGAVFSQEWKMDYKESLTLAETQQKNILLVFSGSDWCGPCMKLEREIWESEAFKAYSSENLILLKADFPRRKKNRLSKELQSHNDELAEKYNINGYFPLVVLLNNKGEVIGKTGYKKLEPKEYINHLISLKQE